VAPLHGLHESACLTLRSRALTDQILVGANYFNQFSRLQQRFDTKADGLFLSPGATDKDAPILALQTFRSATFEQIGLTTRSRERPDVHIRTSCRTAGSASAVRREFRRGRVNEFYHRGNRQVRVRWSQA